MGNGIRKLKSFSRFTLDRKVCIKGNVETISASSTYPKVTYLGTQCFTKRWSILDELKWLEKNDIMLWDWKIMPVCSRNIPRTCLSTPLPRYKTTVSSNLSTCILPEISYRHTVVVG